MLKWIQTCINLGYGPAYWSSRRVILLTLCCATSGVMAAPAVVAQVPLDFGLLALRSNAAVWSLIIASNGTVTPTSSNVIPMGGAVRGEYLLSGFPPNTSLTLEWDDAPMGLASQGLPEYLTVKNYSTPALSTDALGEAVVYLGATMETSGNSTMYADGPYGATVQMRVIYWLDEISQFVTHTHAAIFGATVQSVISVTQQEELSFGLVAAGSDPVLKATMTLNPNGSTSETPAGSARIRYLGLGQPAVIQVTGAAPDTLINITPDPGSTLLTHTVHGVGVPQFTVKDFVTSPGPTGTTDGVGSLQINVGATLETEATATAYSDGTYTGAHTVTVTY